jgi:hypothetical protein
MGSEFNFRADHVVQGKAYPALAEWTAQPYTASWREFGHHWPNTVPCELHEHCHTHGFPYSINVVGDYYTIGLGFFRFDIDYFALVPKHVLESSATVLFYYHEGDNPYTIKQRLDSLCAEHNLPTTCYQFISGNTQADQIPGFHYFPDHELLYWHRNQQVIPASINLAPRAYDFTLLSRTHKWWRATVVADLHRHGLLAQSQWSYNTLSINDREQDNPIELDRISGLRQAVQDFMAAAPYTCDQLTADQHNDHHVTHSAHYTDSYCNIVLETHFDVDGSGGAFLTEKTFKPIKHAQPFVIAGAAGSLQALRDLGYRTFDHVIDNRYDLEPNNTRRWQLLLETIQQISQQAGPVWFDRCLPDIQHNQQHFLASKYNRLNSLYDKLLHQLATS